ncbi:MAG TPA: hypothetical protein VFL86_08095, partial [Burkholderiaceae bacterium]|nr:hypothetical protein [Burkholderiaceae bacterium]
DGVLAESYQYDEAGHRIAVTRDAGGAAQEVTRYRYDARGNVTEVRQPLGQAQGFSYNERDLKSGAVDANGQYERWDFDAYGRLAGSTELSGDTLAHQYDGLGNIAHSSRNHAGTQLDTWYAYDNAGQVLRVADAATQTLTEYAYDAAGRHVQERTWVGGTVVTSAAYGGSAAGQYRDERHHLRPACAAVHAAAQVRRLRRRDPAGLLLEDRGRLHHRALQLRRRQPPGAHRARRHRRGHAAVRRGQPRGAQRYRAEGGAARAVGQPRVPLGRAGAGTHHAF